MQLLIIFYTIVLFVLMFFGFIINMHRVLV